ncbi:aldo/keto reductase [bacterium]|uniref:Aldo/keto reductase n=1 Tax=candidate division WWE3 bacterium CG_4_9_14_3_um_filter_39_7 TaxID=1975080 RepID=A0A2M7X2K5_UNCKA|nr:aldo/keto reductase [bacterium]PJA40404.1 MAG: aldo/keto reductase [candidate division WWE3 bacterium CG_4_9_14_3_um_filter_39_7]
MKYRTLGKTGLKVASVGMGTWQLANDPHMWVGGDLSESVRALAAYVDLGGNFIDTAWIYGYDDENPESHPSHEVIAKYLKESGSRDNVIIATKIAPKNFSWPALKGVPFNDVFLKDHIEKQVEDCLRSLEVDSIDLMQFHVWQDEWSDIDEWKEIVKKLTTQGKVKHWGISINDYQPSNVLKTLDTGLISTVQFIFNIFHQKPTEKLLPYAKEHNIGLIARVPLDKGGLTGKFTLDTTWADGDFRTTYFGGQRLDELVKRTDALKHVMGDEAKTLTELALKYILSFDEVSTVIPGMRKVEYVTQNTIVSDAEKLSLELRNELKNHAWERNFYEGADPALESTGFIEG